MRDMTEMPESPSIPCATADAAGRSRELPRARAPGAAGGGVVRALLIGVSALFLLVMVALPLLAVVGEAFRSGFGTLTEILKEPHVASAFGRTAITALITVPLSIVFGIAAAWSIAKFEWRGKAVLAALIDLPLTVSPVIVGLSLVLLLGARGWLGPTLETMGIEVIFALPGIVLATAFVTVPLVARELIPLMESQSRHEEEAALSLGASGWSTFFRVTLPNIRWGLLYGSVLCAARAIGEFGAVWVVSGHISGQTETVPLLIESLYGEYRFDSAASLAAVLVTFTILSVGIRHALQARDLHRRGGHH